MPPIVIAWRCHRRHCAAVALARAELRLAAIGGPPREGPPRIVR